MSGAKSVIWSFHKSLWCDLLYCGWGYYQLLYLSTQNKSDIQMAVGAEFVFLAFLRSFWYRRMTTFFFMLIGLGIALPLTAYTSLPIFFSSPNYEDAVQCVGSGAFPGFMLVILGLIGYFKHEPPRVAPKHSAPRRPARVLSDSGKGVKTESPRWAEWAMDIFEVGIWMTFGVLQYGEWNVVAVISVLWGTLFLLGFFFYLLPKRIEITMVVVGFLMILVGVCTIGSVIILLELHGPALKEAAIAYVPAGLLIFFGLIIAVYGKFFPKRILENVEISADSPD